MKEAIGVGVFLRVHDTRVRLRVGKVSSSAPTKLHVVLYEPVFFACNAACTIRIYYLR
jgi:hypothetical protein